MDLLSGSPYRETLPVLRRLNWATGIRMTDLPCLCILWRVNIAIDLSAPRVLPSSRAKAVEPLINSQGQIAPRSSISTSAPTPRLRGKRSVHFAVGVCNGLQSSTARTFPEHLVGNHTHAVAAPGYDWVYPDAVALLNVSLNALMAINPRSAAYGHLCLHGEHHPREQPFRYSAPFLQQRR